MLTHIRNAVMARHDNVTMPVSRMKLYIAKILKQQGFIKDYEVTGNRPKRRLNVYLKYYEDGQSAIAGLERVSKPGLRVYSAAGEIPRVFGGLGIAIVSTSKGVMTGQQAYRQGIGGELLCLVW
jgi:small subunit ribosomal protein S8